MTKLITTKQIENFTNLEIGQVVQIRIGNKFQQAMVTGFVSVTSHVNTMNYGHGAMNKGKARKMIEIECEGCPMRVFESELSTTQESAGQALTDWIEEA